MAERSKRELWRAAEARFSDLADRGRDEQERELGAIDAADPGLGAEVRRLLNADRQAEPDFLETGVAQDATENTEAGSLGAFSLGAGHTVGPYTIQQALGRGGMGEVYRALRSTRDDDSFQQTVALKLMRRSLDGSPETRGRFLRERRILARLSHPSIARLIDAGSTEDGRPFLAMEFVEGTPITVACASRGLSETLKLFLEAARAVQFAHENLVIHRDIKPSNVLVADQDESKSGRTSVSLLDFGIAALIESIEDEPTLTRAGLAPATPAYAAPEQLHGQPVSTATDVFALGMLLHELLAGSLPEHWPPTGPGWGDLSPPRLTAKPTLGLRHLPADLDAIVRRAIELEPTRRYATVAALILDLERFREGRPVSARSGNRLYRLSKFARRNRVALALTSALSLALVAGAFGILLQSQRAQRNADRAERVTDVLIQLFEDSDPVQSGGRDVTARELVDRGASRVADQLNAEPELQAEILTVLGRLYGSLGAYEEAAESLARAQQTEGFEQGPKELRARTLEANARLLEQTGEFERAQALLEQSIEIAPNVEPRGRAPSRTREALLAVLSYRLGDRQRAQQLTATLRERANELTNPLERGLAVAGLGDVLFIAGQYEEAEQQLADALVLLEPVIEPPDERLAKIWTDLGVTRFQLGRPAEALAPLRDALRDRQRLYEAPHVEIAHSLRNLSGAERRSGETEVGLERLQTSLEMYRQLFGADHPDVAETVNNLAVALVQSGRADEAVTLFNEAVAIQRRLFGNEHPGLVLPLSSLGNLLTQRGDLETAETHLLEAQSIAERTLEETHPHRALIAHNLASLALRRDDPLGARPYLQQALEGFERTLGPQHPNVGVTLLSLGRVVVQTATNAQDFEQALAHLERSIGVLGQAPAFMRDRLRQAQLASLSVLRELDRPEQALASLLRYASAESSSEVESSLSHTCAFRGEAETLSDLLGDTEQLQPSIERLQDLLTRCAAGSGSG